MSLDVARLGFDIDTGALQRAGVSAVVAARQIGVIGDAADQASAKVGRTGAATAQAAARIQQAVQPATTAVGRLSENTGRAGTASVRAADQIRRLAEVCNAAAAGAQQAQATFVGLASALGGGGVGAAGTLAGAAGGATQGLAGVLSALGPVGLAAGAAVGGVVTLTGAYVALAQAVAPAQDRMTQFLSRLRNAYGGSDTIAAQAAQDIRRLSQEAGTSFQITGDAFLRLSRTREDMGATRQQVLDLTEAVQKLGAISGASSGEIGSGMLQLSQALAAGRLNGDELRSIMENMPALARAIADGLGVSVGQLRAMGAEGELTSEKILGALLGKLPEIRKEFESLGQTTEQAATRAANAFERLMAALGDRINASETMQAVFTGLEAIANSAADAITPVKEVNKELERAIALRDEINASNRAAAAFSFGFVSQPRRESAQSAQDAVDALREQRAAQERRMISSREDERRSVLNVDVVRAEQMLSTFDRFGNRSRELTEQIRKVQAALDDLNAGVTTYSADEAAQKTDRFTRALERLTQEQTRARDALASYQAQTAQMRDDRAANDNVGILQEARVIREQMIEQMQRSVSMEEAVRAVVDRRTISIEDQIDATKRQITETERMSEATLAGGDALMLAEARGQATAAVFGALGGQAAGAAGLVDELASALYGLAQAQAAAAAAAARANLTAGIEQRESLLRQSGGDPRRFRELQRRQQMDREYGAFSDQSPGPGEPSPRMRMIQRREAADREEERLVEAERAMMAAERRAAGGARRGGGGGRRRGGGAAAARESAFEQANDNIASRIRDLELESALFGRQTAEVERARAARTLLSAAMESGKKINAETRDSISALIRAYATATTETERSEAAEKLLAAAKASGVPITLSTITATNAQASALEAAVRKSDELRNAQERLRQNQQELRAFSQDVLGGFVQDIRNGVSATQALENALGKVADKLLELAMSSFFDMIFPSTARGGGNWLSGLVSGIFGGFGGGGGVGAPLNILANANGNAFHHGKVIPFARGGIFHNPTYFPMAGNQTGMLGEAGPEAILPLARGSDGRLGVTTNGSMGGKTIVNVNVNNSTDAKVRVEEKRNATGGVDLKVMIDEMTADNIGRAGSRSAAVLGSRYGVSPGLARR